MILLTAVIVLLVGGVGVVYLGALDDRSSGESPLVDADVTATDERVLVSHVGGESIPLVELDLLVSHNGASERYGLDAANVTGDGDDRFSPGDRFSRSHGLDAGQIQVRLIHTPSNAVVHHAHLDTRRGSGGGNGEGGGTSTTAAFAHSPERPEAGTTVTFVASDAAGNSACRTIVDTADGDDPLKSAFGGCWPSDNRRTSN